jgi:hypothetical protein
MPYARRRQELCWFINHHHERRCYYVRSHPLGDIPHQSKGESQEREENDLDGLLQ